MIEYALSRELNFSMGETAARLRFADEVESDSGLLLIGCGAQSRCSLRRGTSAPMSGGMLPVQESLVLR
jgi:hypothetical protein